MKTEWKPRKINLSTSIITSFIFLVAGFFVGSNWQFIITNFSPYIGFRKSEQANWDSLNELYTELKSFYDGEVTEDNALTGAKRGIAAALILLPRKGMNSYPISMVKLMKPELAWS